MRSVPIHPRQTPAPLLHPLDNSLAHAHPTMALVVKRAHDISQARFTADTMADGVVFLTTDDLAAVDAAMQAAAREYGVRTLSGDGQGNYHL